MEGISGDDLVQPAAHNWVSSVVISGCSVSLETSKVETTQSLGSYSLFDYTYDEKAFSYIHSESLNSVYAKYVSSSNQHSAWESLAPSSE